MGGGPTYDGRGCFGGYPVAPGRWIEAIEQVQDLVVPQLHDFDAAEAKALALGMDDPVPEALALPVFIPPLVEVFRLWAGAQHVGRVMRTGSGVAVDGVNQVDVGGSGAV